MSDKVAKISLKPEKSDPEFWADLHTFIGSDAPLFIELWRETPEGKLFPSLKYFSISALLFGPFWFLYRKLYLWAVGLIALIGVELVFLATTFFPAAGHIILIATGIGVGVFANKIYVNWSVERVKTIRAAISDLSQRQAQLRRQGGVSGMSILLSIGAAVLLLAGLFFGILILSGVRWN